MFESCGSFDVVINVTKKTHPLAVALFAACLFLHSNPISAQPLTPDQLKLVKAVEENRVAAIEKVIGSVIAIYDENRQGGGSGVIIDPSGIALTNHHVIMGSGVKGWGGLADGQMYHWELIGTDPGGDVAIIKMRGKEDFPFTPLGNSDNVRVGDWALAMGNPFVLTEDQKPTVTLGIVSGVKRYQYGAGKNQLVYGNCIQVDSSINPGNSGGPLFNMYGEVIGINGRGSFQDRGRVNVGLGYAISSNQIKNFIPELLATKLVEHGTLDASFSDRGGKVVCSTINEFAPIYEMGLRLGDELLEFEGIPIDNANQFTNLICTLPEGWPAHLEIKTEKGELRTFHSRLIGLPYARPKPPRKKPGEEDDSPEEKQALERTREMMALLSAPPGTVRNRDVNRRNAEYLLSVWGDRKNTLSISDAVLKLTDEILDSDGQIVGHQEMWISPADKFVIERTVNNKTAQFTFDGEKFFRKIRDERKELSRTEAKLTLPILEAMGILAARSDIPFEIFGYALIDGSDKVQRRNAFRFKTTDEDEDWFYFWCSMYNEQGQRSMELLTASPDLDRDGRDGGVNFHEWGEANGWQVPFERDYITNLSEDVNLTSKTTKAEAISLDECADKFEF